MEKTLPIPNITLSDYVNKVIQIASKTEGQIILVGHSMGGIVISQVAEDLGKGKVYKLIYLDAFLLKKRNQSAHWLK